MFIIEKRNLNSIYEQIEENIKHLIFTQVLKTDEKMPSVRALSSRMKINPGTIHRAYRELKTEGYLYAVKGRGYYVSAINTDLIEQKLEKEIKPQLQRLLQVAMYLGLNEEELVQWYKEIGSTKNNFPMS